MEGEGVEIQADVNHTEVEDKKEGPDSAQKVQRKRKQRELPSPTIADRPTRERKSIERLIVSPDKEIKEFRIPKGPGASLKDIPNVVFRLSKRRGGDEVVQALHKVLFGKTAKHAGKANILQFSGFVWGANEEKEKGRVRERLERVVKETLVQISDLLDLRLHKTLKKEDTVLKVFEFLESPHKTTDKLLEESAKLKKSKKAKKTLAKGTKKGRTPAKSPKGKKKTPMKKQTSDEEDDEGDVAVSEDELEEPQVEEEPEIEEEPEDKSDDDYSAKSTRKTKRKRKSKKEQSMQESEDEEEAAPKRSKVQKEKRKPIEKAKKEKKQRSKAEKVKGLKAEKVKGPSDEDLKAAISELLQNADFSKVTFIDVMKQLGEKFEVDLTYKKSHLKALIQEEIARLVGEGDDEEETSNAEPGDKEEKLSGDEEKDEEDDEEQKDHEDASKDGQNDDEGDGDGDGDVENSEGEGEDVKGEKAADEDRDEEMNSVEEKMDGGEDEDVQAEGDDVEAEGVSTDTA